MSSLSSADVETLRRIMTQLNTSTGASTSFAQTGISANFSRALHTDSSQPWIIDSGASDHMIGLSSVFSTYTPSSGKEKELPMVLFHPFLVKVLLNFLIRYLYLRYFMFLTSLVSFYSLLVLLVILTVVSLFSRLIVFFRISPRRR